MVVLSLGSPMPLRASCCLHMHGVMVAQLFLAHRPQLKRQILLEALSDSVLPPPPLFSQHSFFLILLITFICILLVYLLDFCGSHWNIRSIKLLHLKFRLIYHSCQWSWILRVTYLTYIHTFILLLFSSRGLPNLVSIGPR